MRLTRCVLALFAIGLLAFGYVSAGDSQSSRTLPIRKTVSVERSAAQLRALARTRDSVKEFRARTWGCQDSLGAKRTRASVSVWALPVSVGYRAWAAGLWKGRVSSCLKALELRTIPAAGTWKAAVLYVQKIYPGTKDWLFYISDREGCRTIEYCPWVWYGSHPWTGHHIGDDFLGADTVGGPMQFRYSTFDPYWRAAQENLRSRGFVVPEFRMPAAGGDSRYAAWLSPMGQALTAGYMKWSGREGCHWCI